MNENKIILKPINELLKEKFYVPSYQRGYRWKESQVSDLLNDIWDFRIASNSKSTEEFYCLQPLVVTKNDGVWVLIDGQQRLTTIYLILSYLNDVMAMLKKKKYSIQYETRPDSEAFLKNIDFSRSNANIDYFHMCEAYKTIEKWFSGKDGLCKVNFLNTLLNDDVEGKNVKVIWYEVDDQSDQIDIFTRINMGKIPLTNAELIKALFLRQSNFAGLSAETVYLKQLQIASEWDNIESSLQEDTFWYFLNDNAKNYSTRIELIFDLMKEKKTGDDEHFTFYEFNRDFQENKEIDVLWKEIKTYFMAFEEWYRHRDLYHLVGYLVTNGTSLVFLKAKSGSMTKIEFKEFLTAEIRKKVNCQINDLEYGDYLIRPILLLFNIQTLLSNERSNIRFPFDRFKKDQWDIEHIRSKKSFEFSRENRRDWLEAVLEYFMGTRNLAFVSDAAVDLLQDPEKSLLVEIKMVLSADEFSDDEFTPLFHRLLDFFKEDDEPKNIDLISNLALLDASTNRGYKNAPFPIKRKIIIKNDREGTFIPICTKNVFLKSYSKKLDRMMYWQINDADDYLNEIKQTLSIFLPIQNGGPGNE